MECEIKFNNKSIEEDAANFRFKYFCKNCLNKNSN